MWVRLERPGFSFEQRVVHGGRQCGDAIQLGRRVRQPSLWKEKVAQVAAGENLAAGVFLFLKAVSRAAVQGFGAIDIGLSVDVAVRERQPVVRRLLPHQHLEHGGDFRQAVLPDRRLEKAERRLVVVGRRGQLPPASRERIGKRRGDCTTLAGEHRPAEPERDRRRLGAHRLPPASVPAAADSPRIETADEPRFGRERIVDLHASDPRPPRRDLRHRINHVGMCPA